MSDHAIATGTTLEVTKAILSRVLVRLDAGREAKIEEVVGDLAFCAHPNVSIDVIEREAETLFYVLWSTGRTMDPKTIFSRERDEIREFLNSQ